MGIYRRRRRDGLLLAEIGWALLMGRRCGGRGRERGWLWCGGGGGLMIFACWQVFLGEGHNFWSVDFLTIAI